MTRERSIDPFYPIVPTGAWVSRVVGAGARFVQLRCKDEDKNVLRHEIRVALQACAAVEAELVVNDHWDLAIDAGASFVHLGQTDLDTADLSALRSRDIRIGISTHDHAELERALSIDPDYVALGPIYPTTLKAMPWAPQGLPRLGEWKRAVGNRPLVAIGGITLDRVTLCREAGADSVAMVSDIVAASDPEKRTQAWLAATRIAS